MSRKRKSAKKPKNKAARKSALKPIGETMSEAKPRQCPWVVTAKTGVTAFNSLYGIARNYSGSTSFFAISESPASWRILMLYGVG
jgi:hypothetical protein